MAVEHTSPQRQRDGDRRTSPHPAITAMENALVAQIAAGGGEFTGQFRPISVGGRLSLDAIQGDVRPWVAPGAGRHAPGTFFAVAALTDVNREGGVTLVRLHPGAEERIYVGIVDSETAKYFIENPRPHGFIISYGEERVPTAARGLHDATTYHTAELVDTAVAMNSGTATVRDTTVEIRVRRPYTEAGRAEMVSDYIRLVNSVRFGRDNGTFDPTQLAQAQERLEDILAAGGLSQLERDAVRATLEHVGYTPETMPFVAADGRDVQTIQAATNVNLDGRPHQDVLAEVTDLAGTHTNGGINKHGRAMLMFASGKLAYENFGPDAALDLLVETISARRTSLRKGLGDTPTNIAMIDEALRGLSYLPQGEATAELFTFLQGRVGNENADRISRDDNHRLVVTALGALEHSLRTQPGAITAFTELGMNEQVIDKWIHDLGSLSREAQQLEQIRTIIHNRLDEEARAAEPTAVFDASSAVVIDSLTGRAYPRRAPGANLDGII